MPSLTRSGYLKLLPIRLAKAVAQSGVTSAVIACCLAVSCSASRLEVDSVDQRVLIKLTTTRVPSLLIATLSERFTKARICARAVVGASLEDKINKSDTSAVELC